jgi:hypothetical protein
MRAPLPGLFAARPARRRVLWAIFVLGAAFGLAQLPALATMGDHGVGILEFELARTSSKATQLVSDLGHHGRSAARLSLYLDYPYLVGYGLFFAGACTVVAERARALAWRRWATVGVLLAWAALIGAGLDAIENGALLVELGGHTGQPWPGIAFASAAPKLVVVGLAQLYALLGWVAVTAARRRREQRAPGTSPRSSTPRP